jgi:hypothetical protein
MKRIVGLKDYWYAVRTEAKEHPSLDIRVVKRIAIDHLNKNKRYYKGARL